MSEDDNPIEPEDVAGDAVEHSEQVADAAEDTVDSAEAEAEAELDNIEAEAEDAVATLSGTADDAADTVAGNISDVTDSAGAKVEDATDAVTGAVTGAVSGAAATVSGFFGRSDDPDDSSDADGYDVGDDRVRKMLWFGLAIIAGLVLLAIFASQCNDDEEDTGVSGDTEEVAGPSTDEDSDTGDDGDSGSDNSNDDDSDDAGSDSGEESDSDDSGSDDGSADDGSIDVVALQSRVDEILAATGLAGLTGLVDDDGLGLVLSGEVSSDDEVASVEAALAELGLRISNELVVAADGETPTADATDSDPDFTG